MCEGRGLYMQCRETGQRRSPTRFQGPERDMNPPLLVSHSSISSSTTSSTSYNNDKPNVEVCEVILHICVVINVCLTHLYHQ